MTASESKSAPPAASKAAHGGHAEPDLPGDALRVVVVSTKEELREHGDALVRLEEVAAEPNPFFSRPALEAWFTSLLGAGESLALVVGEPKQSGTSGLVVCGAFPLRRTGRRAELHLHRYSFLGTPLVRRDSIGPAWRTFLDWTFEGGARLLRLPRLNTEGPVFRALLDELRVSERPSWVQEQHLRALFVRGDDDAEGYMQRAQARKVRRNLRRARKQLGAKGTLETTIGPPADRTRFAAEFLELEASGWKGEGGTALGSAPASQAWFQDLLGGLESQGRLIGARLALDGKPIAMGVLFADAARTEAAYFKIAYDESLAEFSVGALLQQDLIEALHGSDLPPVVDSCANPGHPMIERLWDGRRLLQSLWIASGTSASRLALASLPAARWAKNLKKKRTSR